MFSSEIFLVIACIGAIAFLLVQNREFFASRPVIKMLMGVALSTYCLTSGHAALGFMGAGFLASSLGDYLLDFPDDKYFLPGLIAFFIAHIAFLIYLWPFASWSVPVCIVIAIFTLGFYIWLKPSFEKGLALPVAAYSAVIALMGMAAVTTSLPSVLIPIGAALFIASDVVLSVEKFKTKFKFDKTINWVLYAGGQIALAIGVVASLAL